MDDELTTMVANSAFIRARNMSSTQARSKKWKKLLTFPNITHCDALELSLSKAGLLSFEEIARQPIGKRLLQQFFAGNPTWKSVLGFITAVEGYSELVSGSLQADMAKEILSSYVFDSKSPDHLSMLRPLFSDSANATRVTFVSAAHHAVVLLSDEPFRQFLKSNYYKRFLQWKMLELQPVEEKHFRFYRILGKGAFGSVFAAHRRDTGKMYALKLLLKKQIINTESIKYVMNERNILERISSPFVVCLTFAYNSPEHLCLVLTLMPCGDLRFHIHEIGTFDTDRTRFYASEIVLGLQHLHSLRILDRDIKPENILMDERGHVRISDLGLAVNLPPGKAAKGTAGTVSYMAPEVLSKGKYGMAVDWWSLGCVIFEMREGYPPFTPKGSAGGEHHVKARATKDAPHFSSNKVTDPSERDLILRFLDKHASSRLGATNKGYDSDPDAVKSHPYFATVNWGELLDGRAKPPFVPDPELVYVKDVHEFGLDVSTSSVKITPEQEAIFASFPGVSSHNWQIDILDTVFNEINPFTDSTPDLNPPVVVQVPWYKQCCTEQYVEPSFDAGSFEVTQKMHDLRKRGLSHDSIYDSHAVTKVRSAPRLNLPDLDNDIPLNNSLTIDDRATLSVASYGGDDASITPTSPLDDHARANTWARALAHPKDQIDIEADTEGNFVRDPKKGSLYRVSNDSDNSMA